MEMLPHRPNSQISGPVAKYSKGPKLKNRLPLNLCMGCLVQRAQTPCAYTWAAAATVKHSVPVPLPLQQRAQTLYACPFAAVAPAQHWHRQHLVLVAASRLVLAAFHNLWQRFVLAEYRSGGSVLGRNLSHHSELSRHAAAAAAAAAAADAAADAVVADAVLLLLMLRPNVGH